MDTSYLPSQQQRTIEEAIESFWERHAKQPEGPLDIRQYAHLRNQPLEKTSDYGVVVRSGQGFAAYIPGHHAPDLYNGKRVYRLIYRHGSVRSKRRIFV